jgi:rubrerythrin
VCFSNLQEIPGCGKFKKKALQNQDLLREMFGDISNDENDHWNPMSSNAIILGPINDKNCEGGEEEHEDLFHDWDYQDEGGEEVHEVSPIIENAKKRPSVVLEIPKKQKSSTTLVIQEQIDLLFYIKKAR